MNQKDERASRSKQILNCGGIKDNEGKKPKSIREESFSSKLFFEKNDFTYIDKIVDPNRNKRDGPKGYPPSSIFMALLLTYLRSMDSVLDLIRFLNTNPEWLVTLNLKKRINDEICYRVPHRSTFSKFANRLGGDKMVDIFSVMVIQLMKIRIIKGGKASLDCSIVRAWFYTASMQKIIQNTTITNARSSKQFHSSLLILGTATAIHLRKRWQDAKSSDTNGMPRIS